MIVEEAELKVAADQANAAGNINSAPVSQQKTEEVDDCGWVENSTFNQPSVEASKSHSHNARHKQ